jgi:glycosyltransferase involved in cell wall biosynthesis
MNSSHPLISVVMPVYNAGRHLEQAMQSVLEQTLGDFEVIAVDDGSTDETPHILAAMTSRDARVKPHHLERNSGIVKALNEGVRLASGKYIARMDADDFIPANRFEKQIAFLNANPRITVVSGAFEVVDAEGRSLNIVKNKNFKSPEVVRWELFFGTSLCHAAVMFLADVVRQVGGYRSEYQYVEDYDLFIRLSKITQMASLSDILFFYREDMEGSISITKREEQQRLDASLRRQLIFEHLQRNPSLETCVLLQRPDLADPTKLSDVLTACETILALYRCHLQRNPWMSALDRKYIRKSAAHLIRTLLNVSPSRQLLWRIRSRFL